MQRYPRRTILAWALSFMPVGLVKCGASNPKEKEKDPTTQKEETRKAALKAAAWMEEEKNSIKNQNHRIWLALAYYALDKPLEAKREWMAAWEKRDQSINPRATLGLLFITAGIIGVNLAEEARDEKNKNLAQQLFTAENTDDTYEIDEYLLQLTQGKTSELITTITAKGLADTKRGNPRFDVSALVALFILLYNTNLPPEQIAKLQSWCIEKKKAASELALIEKSLILAILTFGDGKKTHQAIIDEIRDNILGQQHTTHCWKASAASNDEAVDANFLQTATTTMAIAMSQ